MPDEVRYARSMKIMIHLHPLLLFPLFVVSLPESTNANDLEATYISIAHENDNFGGGSDRYYTSGTRATLFNTGATVPPVIDEIAEHIPTFDINETTSTFYTIGQNLYTPSDIRQAEQDPDDRPWAGFLYGSIGLATMTRNESIPAHVDELEFTLGVVGDAAMGEQTQKFVHKHLTNSPKPEGWDNQIEFEPVFSVSWQRRIPYALTYDIANDLTVRFEPNFSLCLGTLRTYAGTGGTLILTSSRNIDTPPRVRPSMPGTGVFFTEQDSLNWQIFTSLDVRAVARDIFLDGNTFKDSYSVDKKPLIADASAGISITYNDYQVAYTINARSKEFDGQDKKSIFGALTLTKRF